MGCVKCRNKKKCGCADSPLTTPTSCNTNPPCTNGDPCSESFAAECVKYTGNSIVDLGITYGDSMESVIQRLGVFAIYPGCATPDSGCQSALGVKTSSIGATSSTIKWEAVDVAIKYQVEYRLATAVSWASSPEVVAVLDQEIYSDAIAGLTPNSLYYVRINTTCTAGNCYSLIISFTTLAQ